jgi:hypothetical protein
MAFDEKLAERIRQQLAEQNGVVEKRMFGGVVFMLHGHLCVGVYQSALMVRLAPEAMAAALKQPAARPFEMAGRPMKSFLLVDPAGTKTAAGLKKWIAKSVAYAATLPPK